MKNVVRFEFFDFVSFLFLGFILVINLRKFNFESHWNTLNFFLSKKHDARFEYAPWNNVWFCFIAKLSFWKSLEYVLSVFDLV